MTLETLVTPAVQTGQMQAALFYAPGDVRYEWTPIPQPAVGELVIAVDTALTCGTDLKAYRRGHPVLLKNFPCGFGHECAGVVAAVGDGVTAFQPGDRVVAANSAPCETCYFCQKGHFNLCEQLDLLNGAYAQYLKIPAQIVRLNTLKIPGHVPFEAAAFTEPLSVSLRGVDACKLGPGDTVAIMGLGAIGQMMVRIAKAQGATVVALGRNALKREMASTFGQADAVVDMRQYDDPARIVAEFSPEGRGFDAVIEAVGLSETWEQAITMARRGGIVHLFGGCKAGTSINVDTRRLHYDEITLLSLFHHTPDYIRKAMDWIATGRIDPTPLISLELPMSCVTHALELVAEGKALKVALKPEG